jgi:deazaflavin-dependent oxidoreductase (nitroreductase family)
MTQPDKNRLIADPDSLNDFNRAIVEEFRSNGGLVGGPFAGATLLLLHTVGAKSGKPRLSPLAYLTVDDRMLIFGSYAGAPKDPAWVHNLRKNPRAHVEVGTDAYDVEVRELPREERDDLYAKLVEMVPTLGEYQAKTDRVIPLFELNRV